MYQFANKKTLYPPYDYHNTLKVSHLTQKVQLHVFSRMRLNFNKKVSNRTELTNH